MIKYSYEQYKKMIEDYISLSIPDADYSDTTVSDAMKYSLNIGGKRIRPVLVLEFCRLCGVDVEKALPVACALETVHTYSLVHDDLPCMDNDDFRRGQPSCHKKFGYEYALLAGDGLLTYAFEMLTKAKIESRLIVEAVKTLSEYAGYQGMIGGQVLDLKGEENKLDGDTLRKMVSLKTGKLIECACLLGCICGDADETVKEKAKKYAYAVGTAFQIIDDILDVTADEEKFGKPVGSDAENDKSTFVSLFGIEKSREEAKKLTEEALSICDYFGEEGEFLKSFAGYLLERDY